MASLYGIFRARTAVAVCGLIVAQILIGSPAAQAQPFEVIGLGEVEKEDRRGFEAGKVEIEANSAYQIGFPDEAEEETRFASELSVGLGLTEWLKVDGGVVVAKNRGEALTATNVALEATISPSFFHQGAFGIGLFLALEPSIDDDATNEFVFGPVFELSVEPIGITVNTFIEDTFGRNSEEGQAFAYGWQVKLAPEDFEIAGFEFAFGVEGFGEVEDVFGDRPPVDDQEHRIGPVIYLEGHGFEANLGTLVGITNETPDVAIKLNIEIPLGKIF